jgi:hypothetical protein
MGVPPFVKAQYLAPLQKGSVSLRARLFASLPDRPDGLKKLSDVREELSADPDAANQDSFNCNSFAFAFILSCVAAWGKDTVGLTVSSFAPRQVGPEGEQERIATSFPKVWK